jgi:uncharacterized protein (DUF1684 family)
MNIDALELTDWRRRISQLYARVRTDPDPLHGHFVWRSGRDELFLTHPQSPLPPGDPLRETGVPYWPYDPALRFELPLVLTPELVRRSVPTDGDTTTTLLGVGKVELPPPVHANIQVWWLDQYGGGLFLPLRDGTAGHTSYGGGRYVLDTAKGADLGSTPDALIVDLNFLYHPSCRYSTEWQCPLAPNENTIDLPVHAGERI